jgi:hypothetical protein
MIIGSGRKAVSVKEHAVIRPRQGEIDLIGNVQMFRCVRQKNHHVINTPKRTNRIDRLALVIHIETITPVARNDAVAHRIATIPSRTPSLPGRTLCHEGALSLRAFPHQYETPVIVDCSAVRIGESRTGSGKCQKRRQKNYPERNANPTKSPSNNR